MIAYWHKASFVGMNGSGKSELLNWLWTRLQVRRLVLDSKREWQIAGVRPVELTSVDLDERGGFPDARREVDEKIDWSAPIIQVRHASITTPGGYGQLSALFERSHRVAGPLNTAIHELNKVSTAHRCPPALREELTAGASRQHGVWTAYQRPRHVVTEAKTEAQHVFLFPPLDAEDVVEARRGLPFVSAAQAIEWTQRVPVFGYLWADRTMREANIGDPLPNDLRLETANVIRLAPGHVARPIEATV